MSPHRFYIPPHQWKPDRLALDSSETHHATGVLRLEAGERITVFNGEGAEATAEIVKIGKDRIDLKLIQSFRTERVPCSITLGQAVPKGKNMDLIIEKATELGASSIVPLLSERTVVQCDRDEALKKKEKWQRVAVEACKQCGQNWLPQVHLPQAPKDFFAGNVKYDLMLIASLQTDAKHLKAVLMDFGPILPTSVLILVGPEGDFTPAELSLAKSSGCPANHPRPDYFEDGDGCDLLSQRAFARTLLAGKTTGAIGSRAPRSPAFEEFQFTNASVRLGSASYPDITDLVRVANERLGLESPLRLSIIREYDP